jgi:hypothetical protein
MGAMIESGRQLESLLGRELLASYMRERIALNTPAR